MSQTPNVNVIHRTDLTDSDKAIVIQSPCDGLAKAIQQYRRNFSLEVEPCGAGTVVPFLATLASGGTNGNGHHGEPGKSGVGPGPANGVEPAASSAVASCGKCGSREWLKIDGCMVCQGCGYSKCG